MTGMAPRRAASLAALLLLLLLAACGGIPESQRKANLAQAARDNTQLGIDYMRRGYLDIAMDKLTRAIEQDPNYAVAHSSIAYVHARRGDSDRAERHYRRALALDSANPDTSNNFGVFLCQMGRNDEAERYFLNAIRSDQYTTPEAAYTNAGVCVRRSDPVKAEKYFREALKANPAFPDALAQMAWTSFQQGDHMRARAFMQRFEVVGHHSAETLSVAIQTERALNDGASAARYERRLLTDFPESEEAAEIQKNQQ